MIIAVLSFALLSVCGSLYINHISEAIGGQLYILAWGIYVIAIFMNLYYYYYSSILIGVGGIAENNKAKVIASIVQIVLCTVLLIFRASILAPALAYLLYGVLYRGLAKRYFYEYSNIGDNIELFNNPSQYYHLLPFFQFRTNRYLFIISTICYSNRLII